MTDAQAQEAMRRLREARPPTYRLPPRPLSHVPEEELLGEWNKRQEEASVKYLPLVLLFWSVVAILFGASR